MRNTLFLLAALITVLTSGCSFSFNSGNAQSANSSSTVNTASTPPAAKPANVSDSPAAAETKLPVQSCGEPKMAGKNLIKKQTFPIDFKPFVGGCFVTFGSKEDMLDEKDVPRGSRFYVFKDGKSVFEFPDAFGGQSACWIEGVSFSDLNADGLTDVIVAGKCLAAKDSYPSNAVYVNTGTAFTTDDEANTKIEELKTLKEIEAFVKKNQKDFF